MSHQLNQIIHVEVWFVDIVVKPVSYFWMIQQVFEDTPRTTPRVPTEIPVQCDRRGASFAGALLSISENGGLLRCQERLPLGACFDMNLTLPGAGPLSFQAEAAYQLVPNVGVVFSGLAPSHRAAIGAFFSRIGLPRPSVGSSGWSSGKTPQWAAAKVKVGGAGMESKPAARAASTSR